MSTSAELLLKTLDANGHEIESLGTPTAPQSATYTDNATEPAPIGSASDPGTSFVAAAQDHTHEGIHSVHVDGDGGVAGDVNLVSGDGIEITRTGPNITIKQASGSTNKITIGHDGAAYSKGIGEEIIREFHVNFDDAGASSIKAMLAAIVKASAGVGTYSVHVGATAPGDIAGSTVRATFTTSSTTEELKEVLGSAFANPGGHKLVQITANNDNAAGKSFIRGINISFG